MILHKDKTVSTEVAYLKQVLEQVTDPEIPVITISEMGILRSVCVNEGTVEVVITPTYSGCPAIDQITEDIGIALAEAGYSKFTVTLKLSPAWTTNWMGKNAREKLRNYGIAPPCKTSALDEVTGEHSLQFTAPCPQCKSINTQQISEFGSTACKALWKCLACQEPFDYFKPL